MGNYLLKNKVSPFQMSRFISAICLLLIIQLAASRMLKTRRLAFTNASLSCKGAIYPMMTQRCGGATLGAQWSTVSKERFCTNNVNYANSNQCAAADMSNTSAGCTLAVNGVKSAGCGSKGIEWGMYTPTVGTPGCLAHAKYANDYTCKDV